VPDINNTIILSLRDDLDRRQHIVNHFDRIGIEKFCFWPAIRHDDGAVMKLYRDAGVSVYPPCFRCRRCSADCVCSNNIIIPQQIANWISFVSLWRSLPDDSEKYYLICEDDVAFHTGAMDLLGDYMRSFHQTKKNVLIRLSNSGEMPFLTLAKSPLKTTDRVVMSNVAYIINGTMAAMLCRSFSKISTTSDIWLHSIISNRSDVQALTIDPLLATDLSYNKEHALFVSRIHPKGIDAEDSVRKEAHTMRVETIEEYNDLLSNWGVRGE
jgi:GR25 family glycosyltransferase involved in LPS biosynthesis